MSDLWHSEELAEELAKIFPTPAPKICGRDEWAWRNSEELAATRQRFTASEMLLAADQPVNPPTDNEELIAWWEQREFLLKGEVLISSSIIPPEVKAKILSGLESKKLTWEYLLSSQFLELAKHAAVQVSDIMLVLDMVMGEEGVKSDAGLLLEELTELFWRTRTTPAGIEFDQEVADVMEECRLSLSTIMLEGNSHGEKLRKLTHPGSCECWNCAFVRNKVDEKFEKHAWESYRLQKLREGVHIMSYKQYMEIENDEVSDAVWHACAETKAILNDPKYAGKTVDPTPKRKLPKNASKEAKLSRAMGITPLAVRKF